MVAYKTFRLTEEENSIIGDILSGINIDDFQYFVHEIIYELDRKLEDHNSISGLFDGCIIGDATYGSNARHIIVQRPYGFKQN
jgi:hypothetical protein